MSESSVLDLLSICRIWIGGVSPLFKNFYFRAHLDKCYGDRSGMLLYIHIYIHTHVYRAGTQRFTSN